MVTLQDIADKAGVSKGTVSYVLSGKHRKVKISDATSERIRGIAREMGYRPNSLARAVATGDSKVIGFLAGGGKSEFVQAIIDGMQDVLEPAGYLLKLLPFPADTTEADYERLLDTALGQRLSGVVCHSAREDALRSLCPDFSAAGVPFGIVSNSYLPDGVMHVGSNDAHGVALAVEHLVSLGHRRIAFLTHSPDAPFSVARLEGFLQGMSEAGLVVPEEFLLRGGSSAEMRARTLALLVGSGGPTALFCNGDGLALNLMTFLAHEGIRCPEEISIVGFGNFRFGGHTVPALTTIYEPFAEMGQAIAEDMLRAVESKPPRQRRTASRTIDTHLIIRDSTGSEIEE